MVCWLLKGMVERLFKRLSALLEAVRNAFAGRGFRTAEGVMRDAARGGIGRRGEGALAMPDTERYSVSNDDGQAKEAGDGRVPTDLVRGMGRSGGISVRDATARWCGIAAEIEQVGAEELVGREVSSPHASWLILPKSIAIPATIRSAPSS
jgi:hypothetical protein